MVSTDDFLFACENAANSSSPWHRLRVVSFRGTESLSRLYRYEIVLLAHDAVTALDPDELLGQRASLRISTLTEPTCRLVHGIVIEALELGCAAGGMLYQIVLAPPLARAMHRSRCRVFLDKTTRQVIDAVLQGDPELVPAKTAPRSTDVHDDACFASAGESYTWRIVDASRIDDVATRGYCVQYDESDFAFVCRLLEEEGITFHYENGDGVCLLVLSDNDSGRTRLDPPLPLGVDITGRSIQSIQLGGRLRPRKVTSVDYNWKQPALDLSIAEPSRATAGDLVLHEYPGGYTESRDVGKPFATRNLDRLQVEARYAIAESHCRVLGAGSIFEFDHEEPRYDGEYLVTTLEVRGEQSGTLPPATSATLSLSGVPYSVMMECARRGKDGHVSDSRFRPARITPKPRILGSQTAFVTAEPNVQGKEIHIGGPPGADIGCVRLRFHWDTDTARHAKEPTSCWVRVNQVFAGAGEGAVFHPRVGTEVIVEFEDGDPDRPIIVGRVYNGKNRPPGGTSTASMFKTMSSPATGEFNELTFDDTAGHEQIKMHTPHNLNSHAGHDRTERIDNNSSSSVGVDRNETTGAHQNIFVGGNKTAAVGVNDSITVGADQNVTVGGNQTVEVGGSHTVTVAGPQAQTSAALQTMAAPEQLVRASGTQTLQSQTLNVNAEATATLQTAVMNLIGSGVIAMDAGQVIIKSGPVTIVGGEISITGGNVTLSAGAVGVSGGKVDIVGGMIKLN